MPSCACSASTSAGGESGWPSVMRQAPSHVRCARWSVAPRIVSPWGRSRIRSPRLAREDDGLALVVVGRPAHLDGSPTAETGDAEQMAERLRRRVTVQVVLQDERLSSHEAEGRLASTERDWRVRKQKLDAAAAAVILQDYLDAHVSARVTQAPTPDAPHRLRPPRRGRPRDRRRVFRVPRPQHSISRLHGPRAVRGHPRRGRHRGDRTTAGRCRHRAGPPDVAPRARRERRRTGTQGGRVPLQR